MKKTKTILLLITLGVFVSLHAMSQANTFGWAKKIGSQYDDSGNSIATDASGDIYTTGQFQGTVDFDPNSGTYNLTSNGLSGLDDMFIQKLDGAGNLLWAKQTGGPGYDYGYSIIIDAAGNIITTGSFQDSVDFDPGTAGTFNLGATGGHDIFIQKLDPNGNFLWAKKIGGTGEDEGLSVTTDAAGNIIATGYFSNVADFDPGAATYNLTSNGGFDNFIIKLDAAGNFRWATQIGGPNNDFSESVTIDAGGNVFSTGTFGGTVDFDPGLNSFPLISNGGPQYGDIFIQKLDTGGNFIWAKQMGWFGDDIGTSIKADASGNVYTTGWFQVTVDFDPGTAISNLTTAGAGYTDDVFIQKLDNNGNFIWAKNMGGLSDDRGISLAIDNAGKICTTGIHSGPGDFDPGNGTVNLSANGAFISKLDSGGNFIWAKEMNTGEGGRCIASDATGNLYSTGGFDHTADFNTDAGTLNLASNNGSIDAYIQKLNSPSVGIDENIFNNSSAIFPNPTKGQFSIDLGKTYSHLNIEIKNIAGEIVYSNKLSETNLVKINLKQHAGFYFVSINDEGSRKTFKLVID